MSVYNFCIILVEYKNVRPFEEALQGIKLQFAQITLRNIFLVREMKMEENFITEPEEENVHKHVYM